jgi:hypothetical protein
VPGEGPSLWLGAPCKGLRSARPCNDLRCALFDMSGGTKAKPLGRPLDGGVGVALTASDCALFAELKKPLCMASHC